VRYKGFELYPFQEQAIRAVEAGRSVMVSAPTGAGKTVIAEYAIDRALELGQRIAYTSPVKALTNQKYRDFNGRYGDQIGIMTGDVTLNGEAPVLLMTTEILRNTIFEDPRRLSDIHYVIMDEVHYISDVDRGTVWEESLIFAPKGVHFLGLSATISNMEEFRAWVESVREEPVELVSTDFRPVPLSHHLFVPGVGVTRISGLKKAIDSARGSREKRGRRAPDIVDHLVREKLLSCLYFCFSRRECEARARAAERRRLLDRDEEHKILTLFDELCERYEVEAHSATEVRKMAGRGILYHHAGMLPVFKEIVERLFTTGLIRLLFTTETFAVGVNMPARSVVFSSLRKFDGVGFSYLPTLSYYQMAGRAGRQGMDTEGHVFTVVNLEFDTQKDLKKVIFGKVEPLQSRFNLSYSAVLNLLDTLGDDIMSAVDRSFASWQRGGSSKKDRAILEARLGILASHGYIAEGQLTGKGRLAARLQGYEIQMTELYWAGCLEELSPEDCAVMVSSIVFEARRGDYHQRIDVGLGPARNRAVRRIQEFRRSETKAGMEEGIKLPDFGLSASVRAWARGCTFAELNNFTSSQDGDIVRNLRMAVQILRQFAVALKGDSVLHERLTLARDLINRDEVDAERQLRLG
jgi:superfamily II RNA helicase